LNAKPNFDGVQAVKLADSLRNGGHTGELDKFLADWRGYVEENYSLTDDQENWLNTADEQHFTSVKDAINRTVESGGQERLVVTIVPDQTRPGGIFHELRAESAGAGEKGQGIRPYLSIVIAHCDANCQNWGWGPG